MVIVPAHKRVAEVAAVFATIGRRINVSFGGSMALVVEKSTLELLLLDGRSRVTCWLVHTLGKPVEHVCATPSFALGYRRWVVVNEADTLLA